MFLFSRCLQAAVRVGVAACWAAWLAPAVVFAQGAPPPQPAPSQREANAYLLAEFRLLDVDSDGVISEAEFQQNRPKAIAKARAEAKQRGYEPQMVSRLFPLYGDAGKHPSFSQMDGDGNGRIAFYREYYLFPVMAFTLISQADRDGDGAATSDEYVQAKIEEHKATYLLGNELYEPPSKTHKLRWGAELKLRDRDNDGEATWEEMRAFADRLPPASVEGTAADASFVMQDADFDGAISREEFLADARKTGGDKFLKLKEEVFRLRDLDNDNALSFVEFIETGENPARSFLQHDKDRDGALSFSEIRGVQWVAGKSAARDRAYFARADADGDGKTTWKEYRSVDGRGVAMNAIDHLEIDNSISRKEWNAVEQEYQAAQDGRLLTAQAPSSYAAQWFPGIFDVVQFDDVDRDESGAVSWDEFRSFPD